MLGIGEKFVIICPNCGNYAEASKGLFNKIRIHNRIKCPSCNEDIVVSKDRCTSVECTHCHNIVMYDQADESPVCPVCKEPINVKIYKDGPTVKLRCPECGFSLLADRKADECVCPVCGNEMNIQLELQKEERLQEGLISVIEFKGDPNVLVWKHKNENFAAGSRLIVHESQEAIFLKDGKALDTFPSGQYTLDMNILPQAVTQQAVSEGDVSFRAEVYFVSMTTVKGIKWGTPEKINYMDPVTNTPISIGASGSYDIRIVNSRKILAKLVGTTDVLLAAHDTTKDQTLQGRDLKGVPTIREYFRDTIMNNVKRYLPAAIKQDNIDLFEIDEHLYDISDTLRNMINEALDDYGIDCPQFIVSRISTPEDDPYDPAHDDFVYRKKHYREKYTHGLQREKEKQLEQERREDKAAAYEEQQSDVEAQGKIELTKTNLSSMKAQMEEEAKAERLKIQAGAAADAERLRAAAGIDTERMKGEAEADIYRMKGMADADLIKKKAEAEAYATQVKGEANADAYSRMASAEAMEMKQKGYSYQDVMSHEYTMKKLDKMSEGNFAAGNAEMPWDCSCGKTGISPDSKFCPNCGQAKPVPKKDTDDTWDCSVCGAKNLKTKFCPTCGNRRPEKEETVIIWNCECGAKGLTGNWCPECGKPRPEPWDCECGAKKITSKFCPECGKKRPERWNCSCGEKNLTSKCCPNCGRPRPESWIERFAQAEQPD